MQCRQTLETTVDDTSVHGLLPCPPGTQMAERSRLECKTAANHIAFERTRPTVEINLSITAGLAPWYLLKS